MENIERFAKAVVAKGLKEKPPNDECIYDLMLNYYLASMLKDDEKINEFIFLLIKNGVKTYRHLTYFTEEQFFKLFPATDYQRDHILKRMQAVSIDFRGSTMNQDRAKARLPGLVDRLEKLIHQR